MKKTKESGLDGRNHDWIDFQPTLAILPKYRSVSDWLAQNKHPPSKQKTGPTRAGRVRPGKWLSKSIVQEFLNATG